MSQPDNSGSEPRKDAQSLGGPLDELDEQLARAADRASSLAEQVGQQEVDRVAGGSHVEMAAPVSPEQVVEAELKRTETFTKQTADQLGARESGLETGEDPTAGHKPSRDDTTEDDLLEATIAASTAPDPAGPVDEADDHITTSRMTPANPGSKVAGVAETDRGLTELEDALERCAELGQSHSQSSDTVGEGEVGVNAESIGADHSSDSSQDVPDFMREFMQHEGPADSPNDDESSIDPSPERATSPRPGSPMLSGKFQSPDRPGVVGTGMLGRVGHAPALETANEEEEQQGQDDVPDGGDSSCEADEITPGAIEAIQKHIEPMAYQALSRLAGLLERIDRPISWMNPRLREVLGWAALATLGTAVLVFVIALF